MSKQTVLITGASSGIGEATAKAVLKLGHTVYAAARRIEKMKDLEALGAIPIKLDVTKEEEIVAAVDLIQKQHGGVDILINNAGFGLYGAVEDTSLADARYQFDVNMFGVARLTQEVLPYMREQGAGKIVNIASMGGKIYTPLGAWYHATKHAIEGWSDCLRIELKQFGIDVIIIEPGIIQTSFGDVLLNPMLERSGNTAYGEMTRKLAEGTKRSYEKNAGSPPSLIANTIGRAITASNPKTRYVAGKFAKPLIFIRKWFGDKVYDRVVLSQVK